MNKRKLVRTIDGADRLTKIYHTDCSHCDKTGECPCKTEWDFESRPPKPNKKCCSCKGKKYHESRESHQKYICVGGPKDGTFQLDTGFTNKNPEYVLFNRSSRWQGYEDVPSAVLVWARKVRVVKAI